MNIVCRNIFRAIHEGRWLSISYRNQSGEITSYWISVQDIDWRRSRLIVYGLRLRGCRLCGLTIYVSRILSADILEGTYCPVNHTLTDSISRNPSQYRGLFTQVPNMKILNYLADCYRLDSTPYIDECGYTLVKQLDGDSFTDGKYALSDAQFAELVNGLDRDVKKNIQGKLKRLALNVLSVQTPKGLYVLAYRSLHLDVVSRELCLNPDITVCREFTVNGDKQSVRSFLEEEDCALLNAFEKNSEAIKNSVARRFRKTAAVDDLPYLIAISNEKMVDLNAEYDAIAKMYADNKVTAPVAAFFGELSRRQARRKYPKLAPVSASLNLDQMLAMHNALKYPLTYVQGPPGTGKTSTIINTIAAAFTNGRTVLFSSNNNHPIDGVCAALSRLRCGNETIPFPIVRLGNNEKVDQAMDDIMALFEQASHMDILEEPPDIAAQGRSEELAPLLERYEQLLDLHERKETLEELLKDTAQIHFNAELQIQLNAVNQRIRSYGAVKAEDALGRLADHEEALARALRNLSIKYIRQLQKPAFSDLLSIIYLPASNEKERGERVKAFNLYLRDGSHLKQFLRVFPVIATTCLSAHKLGTPGVYFDMVIMDEASQCGAAVSLMPILRGESLMLVGDPQQLAPVVLLNNADNEILKERYDISKEYDYAANSVYTTFLACDAVSDEVLLSHHYRCHKKIIDFNNRKYYGGKLKVESRVTSETPLLFMNVPESAPPELRNTSSDEMQAIVDYIGSRTGKSIGVITPFVNQSRLIGGALREAGLEAACGTVHGFQGDEKDIILLSLAITGSTTKGAYDWVKNNKSLINVATSRAKEQLVLVCDEKHLNRLSVKEDKGDKDDLAELYDYVRTNGERKVTQWTPQSRALGIKPYSSDTEQAFLSTLSHALSNIPPGLEKRMVRKEVPISHVFRDNLSYTDLFYTGRFDFVVYEKTAAKREYPILAIELDGMEHANDLAVKERDKKKTAICLEHGFELIRVENAYARRYHYIKDILLMYFKR